MNKKNEQNHLMLADMECAKDCKLNFTIKSEDILLDLKFIISEYYFATFSEEGTGLKLSFNNGQSFILKAEALA